MSWKAKEPKLAVPPVCWGCDKKLYAGGRSYVMRADEQGIERPYHKSCDPEAR